jgi:hypothetical protein
MKTQTPKRIGDLEMSDLFFNHQHPCFDVCFDDENVTNNDMKEAILLDATNFVESYPSIIMGYTAEEFAEDFMDRL